MARSRRGTGGTPKKKGEKMQTATGHDSIDRAIPGIDSRVQHEIGKHLRAHYDGVVSEPVPDRIMQLLEMLEQSVIRKK